MAKTMTKQQAHLQYIKERASELMGNEYVVVVLRNGEELVIGSADQAEDLKGLQARQVLYTVEWFPGSDPSVFCGRSCYTDYENDADNLDAFHAYQYEKMTSNECTEITYDALNSGEKYESMGKAQDVITELTANPYADIDEADNLKTQYYIACDNASNKVSALRAKERKAERENDPQTAGDWAYKAEKAQDDLERLQELYNIAERKRVENIKAENAERNQTTADRFGVSLEVVECLRDIETLTEEEAAEKYPADLLRQAEELGERETTEEDTDPDFNRYRPTSRPRVIDSVIYQADGECVTLNKYEDGTIRYEEQGRTLPMTAPEWENLCHVFRDILKCDKSQQGAA